MLVGSPHLKMFPTDRVKGCWPHMRAAVGDLDGAFAVECIQRVLDGWLLSRNLNGSIGKRQYRFTVIFTTTHVGTKAIVKGDLHTLRGWYVLREGNTTE